MNRALTRSLFGAVCLLLTSITAHAHDVMGTVLFVDLGLTRVHLTFELPVDELRLALGEPSQPGVSELPASGAQLADYVLSHLKLSAPDGSPFSLAAKPGEQLLHDQRNWQKIEVDATAPENASARDFVLETDVIDHQVLSHHIFVFLRRDLASGQLGEPVYLDTLHYQIHQTHIQREAGSLSSALVAVFRLGVSHIAEGSDHLLFLFTLLLPAALTLDTRRRWGTRRSARRTLLEVLQVVTAFTLGHSLTLLLGAMGLARLPTALVESLIALSVLVSAAHAMVPIFPGKEAWLALGFGLVHGLGFASALDGLGVDGSTLLISVLGFNLGVEAMQALLVALTLPWLYLLQGTRLGPPVRQAGSLLACVTAAAWLAQRALGLELPLLGLVDALLRHGLWIVAGLAALALIAHRFDARERRAA
jgi:hypothetical protein